MATGPPGTHARSATRPNGSEDVWQRIHHDLASILNVLEGRLLYLIREGGRSGIPPEAIVSELSFLSRDLRAGFRRLVEVEERRDLSYKTAQELHELHQHFAWLFRRIALQEIFFRKLALETRLRNLISAEAFAVYEMLLSLEDDEREALSSSDDQLRARMMKE